MATFAASTDSWGTDGEGVAVTADDYAADSHCSRQSRSSGNGRCSKARWMPWTQFRQVLCR